MTRLRGKTRRSTAPRPRLHSILCMKIVPQRAQSAWSRKIRTARLKVTSGMTTNNRPLTTGAWSVVHGL